MSFGFGIGDFITIIDHVGKLRKAFSGAPSQFKEISDELGVLQSVVNDVDTDLHTVDLSRQQTDYLKRITENCRGRIWRRATWDPSEVDRLRDRVCVNVANLNAFNGRLNRLQVTELLINISDEQDKLCLEWLSSTTHAATQDEYRSIRQPGSGQWFLESQSFQQWMNMPRQTLLCPGIPGAGKTIIASAAIDAVESFQEGKCGIGIAYIYCEFQYLHDERQKIDRLLACITRQILQSMSKIPQSVFTMFNKHKSRGTRPSIRELSEVLVLAIENLQQVFIIVDALDELIDSTQFLDEISKFQAIGKVNFLATARFIPEITTWFQNTPVQEIQASREDMTSYLSTSLKTMNYLSKKPQLHPEIISKICEAADGMFLLARLHLNSLAGKLSPKAIRTELDKVTSGSQTCADAYDKTMQRILDQDSDIRTLALSALTWVTYSKRPLTPKELQHALAIEIGEPELDEDNISDIEDLIAVCAGLVTITVDRTTDIVRLVHYTAQEYFELRLAERHPHPLTEVAKACITYISFDAFAAGSCQNDAAFEERLENYPLYSYAAKNWGYYVKDEVITDSYLLRFLEDAPKTDACGQAIFTVKGYVSHGEYCLRAPVHATGLHLIAYFGLPNAANTLISRAGKFLDVDSLGRTPFEWAAYSGQIDVMRLLLDKEMDPNQRGFACRSPISLAASTGRIDMIELLLNYGAMTEARCTHGRPAISWGALEGHEDVVRFLLEKGANPNAKDEDNRIPLYWAAVSGQPHIVNLLLPKTSDPDSLDIHGRTALSQAAENGDFATVKMLLNSGCKADLKDNEGKTPLTWADHYGNSDASNLLRKSQFGEHFKKPDTNQILSDSSMDASIFQDISIPDITNFPLAPESPNSLRRMKPPGANPAHPSQESDSPNYKHCQFCYADHVILNRAVYRRHIEDKHFPRRSYRCPMPGCSKSQQRKDKIMAHMRTHPGLDHTSFVTEEFPAPSKCAICGSSTNSWDSFYQCIFKHGKT